MQDLLDVKTLIQLLWRKALWIIASTFLCGAIAFAISQFVLSPKFTSEISLYVNNSNQSSELSAVNINDINASQKLVNTYIVILQNDEVLEQVTAQLVERYSLTELEKLLPFSVIHGEKVLQTETLRKYLKMKSVNNTEVLQIKVETLDPELSAEICTLIAEIAPGVLSRVVKAGSVETIGQAKPNYIPSFPNTTVITLIGFIGGAVISILIVLVLYLFDNTIKGEDDLKKNYNIPVLGEVPDFSTSFRGGYQAYGK